MPVVIASMKVLLVCLLLVIVAIIHRYEEFNHPAQHGMAWRAARHAAGWEPQRAGGAGNAKAMALDDSALLLIIN